MDGHSAMKSADLARHIEPVARTLLGEPNPNLSKPNELRFGTHGSVSVKVADHENAGAWFDHERNEGGGVLDLICHKTGLTNGQAIEWMRSKLGIDPDDRRPTIKRRLVAMYDYCDADSHLLYQVCRYHPKDFRQRRPDGKGGWSWDLKGIKPTLYRLPELLSAIAAGNRVFVCEGEKDVDNLRDVGLTATTNHGGAGKFAECFGKHFHGADVVVLPDNDPAGRKHAQDVAQTLMPFAASVRIVDLIDDMPGFSLKGDVSDWLAAGGTSVRLETLANAASVWQGAIPPASAAQVVAPVPPEFTDDALALEFSKRHADNLRHVAVWGKWLECDGKRWRQDETMRSFDLARMVCRDAAARSDNERVAARCAAAMTVAAVERLAKADRRHATTTDIWDADPWLLNTPAGVVDLRTGKIGAHRPDLYMTKITGAPTNGTCPGWLAFLDKVTGRDPDLQAFLRRVAGYCLTGVTREHALFFCHGTGGNGKGVFIGTLTGVLGDYATVAPMDTFTASGNDRHPTDLAGLRGARLVSAQETEEGRCWAESRIKALTGGDPVSARFMRQDFFTFTPQFKLVIAGNHRPGLRNVDEAIRRRLHLVPFTVTIPPSERDSTLPDRLKAEWPGILAWMIEGCLEWQRMGLAPPPAVLSATDEYLGAEDAVSLWMAECLKSSACAVESSADLYASWKRWAEAAGEVPGTQKRLSQNLIARGARPKRQGGTGKSGFEGFGIIRRDYTDEVRYGT